MARRKPAPAASGHILVDVIYEDGSRLSNRKVSNAQLSGFDDEADIRQAIEEQDRKVEEMSGKARGPIASITRAGKRSGDRPQGASAGAAKNRPQGPGAVKKRR